MNLRIARLYLSCWKILSYNTSILNIESNSFQAFQVPKPKHFIDHVAFFDFWPFIIFSTILQCCDPCYSDDRAEIDESSAYDASTSNLSSIECLHVCQIKLDHLQPHIHWHLKSINSSTKLSHCLQYLKISTSKRSVVTPRM